MSDPSLGLTMLGLIVIAIMMGFPTAFTLMGLGMLFGYLAFWTPSQHWYDNQVFDLMVQRTYGVMTNDTLLSVPLFVFMGYIMERAALVDRMFHSVQLAFRRVPASLAVTTLLVCAFWGIASGIVGAVVVLMGVIAMRPMLNAGYDVRLASGAITAGGTLGILIPPSVMLIVYAAVAGESIVKLYAAAMLPGFFLTFLYLAYILGWAIINPKIAPKLPPEQYRIAAPEWLRRLERGSTRGIVAGLLAAMLRPKLLHGATSPDGHPITYDLIVKNVLTLMVPAVLTIGIFASAWWYVVIYNAPSAAVAPEKGTAQPLSLPPAAFEERPHEVPQEKLQELGGPPTTSEYSESPLLPDGPPQEMGSLAEPPGASAIGKTPDYFYLGFWGLAAISSFLLAIYYWRMDGEQLEILKELVVSVVPLGVLTVVVLAVILFGITTATESAAMGALGALYLAVMAKYPRQVWLWSLLGAVVGVALSWQRGGVVTVLVSGSLGGVFAGTLVPWVWGLGRSKDLWQNLKES
ncbi:MAG TPA: TRAP transporter large permease subunit, partial [Candidatus Binatia bacterium]